MRGAALGLALDETLVAGVRPNLALLHELVADSAFRAGDVDTGMVDRRLAGFGAPARDAQATAFAAAVQAHVERGVANSDPWSVADAFQFVGHRRVSRAVEVDGAAARGL